MWIKDITRAGLLRKNQPSCEIIHRMKSDRPWLPLLLMTSMMVGVVLCLWTILSRKATPTEALLLSVLLTVFSVLGSWIASAYYAEHSFDRNLRVFALKASEKVTNLSNELDRLIGFLQQELNTEDYESPSEALLARDMRIQATIHVINTLKSVNDRSLSDWEGVIGEEIIAQREEQELREEQLRELLERVSTLPQADHESGMHDPAALRRELDAVRRDIKVLGAQIGGVPVRQPRASGKESVQKACPKCGKPLSYRQRTKSNSVKNVQCEHCQAKLFSIVQNGEFVLNEKVSKSESIRCPICSVALLAQLSAMPGASTQTLCPECNSELGIVRRSDTIHVRANTVGVTAAEQPVLEELIAQVSEKMPGQPWAVGTAQRVARELGVPYQEVRRAVQELIRRKHFKLQIDGELYERVAPSSTVVESQTT